MSKITVISKQPPGVRCTLYMRFAEVIGQRAGLDTQIKYCGDEAQERHLPPAMLIGETLIAPSDGVIITPEDLIAGLTGRCSGDALQELHQALHLVQERMMEEWASA